MLLSLRVMAAACHIVACSGLTRTHSLAPSLPGCSDDTQVFTPHSKDSCPQPTPLTHTPLCPGSVLTMLQIRPSRAKSTVMEGFPTRRTETMGLCGFFLLSWRHLRKSRVACIDCALDCEVSVRQRTVQLCLTITKEKHWNLTLCFQQRPFYTPE